MLESIAQKNNSVCLISHAVRGLIAVVRTDDQLVIKEFIHVYQQDWLDYVEVKVGSRVPKGLAIKTWKMIEGVDSFIDEDGSYIG